MFNRKGFTLIELMIYITIVAVILVTAVDFGWDIIYGYVKTDAYREAGQNGRLVAEVLTREIRSAVSVSGPSPGGASSSLFLVTGATSTNPTIIDLNSGRLRVQRGASGPYFLTSSDVEVASATFSNLSYAGASGTVRFEIMINRVNPAGAMPYSASVVFKGTATVRK